MFNDSFLCVKMRKAKLTRKTKETNIALELNIDGAGVHKISTGIGFFDHMLELFACHGSFDLNVTCDGDIKVDGHHTVEDIGIVLGEAFDKALGERRGIKRYASLSLPMDECLCDCALDISGRSVLVYNADIVGKSGDFDCELTEEFLRAFATKAGLTLHINLRYGTNNHHKVEAIFKAVARAIRKAVKVIDNKIPSSKGVI